MPTEPQSPPANQTRLVLWGGVGALFVIVLFLGWFLFLKEQTLAEWAESRRRNGWVLLAKQDNEFGRVAAYHAGDGRLAVVRQWSGGQMQSVTWSTLGEGKTDVIDEAGDHESLVTRWYLGLWTEPSGWIASIRPDLQGDIQLMIFLNDDEPRREGSTRVFDLEEASGPPAFEMQIPWPGAESAR
jgi:hypothetical protein